MGFLEAIHDAEIELFRAMNLAGSNELLDIVMLFFTFLGSYVIVLVCLPLWFRKRRDAAFDIVIVIILATIASEALKLVFDRSRPAVELSDVNSIVGASGPSFPSSHATRAFAAATIICFAESRRIGLLALGIAGLIAISRVYLGLHWPTDILAGAVLGTAVAIAWEEFAKRSDHYRSTRATIISRISRKPG